MAISKMTPILIVDSVEKNIPFWRDQLGYEVAHSVPHGNELGFVILKRENSEVMIQSSKSIGEDLKLSEKLKAGDVLLYADVESLDQTLKANKDAKVLVEKRVTDYGATESWLRIPSGTILGLAQFK